MYAAGPPPPQAVTKFCHSFPSPLLLGRSPFAVLLPPSAPHSFPLHLGLPFWPLPPPLPFMILSFFLAPSSHFPHDHILLFCSPSPISPWIPLPFPPPPLHNDHNAPIPTSLWFSSHPPPHIPLVLITFSNSPPPLPMITFHPSP